MDHYVLRRLRGTRDAPAGGSPSIVKRSEIRNLGKKLGRVRVS